MPTNKSKSTLEKLRAAFQETEFLAISEEHKKQNDVWSVSVLEEKLELSSLKHFMTLGIPLTAFAKDKTAEDVRDSAMLYLSYFASGIETGIALTQRSVSQNIQELLFNNSDHADQEKTQAQ